MFLIFPWMLGLFICIASIWITLSLTHSLTQLLTHSLMRRVIKVLWIAHLALECLSQNTSQPLLYVLHLLSSYCTMRVLECTNTPFFFHGPDNERMWILSLFLIILQHVGLAQSELCRLLCLSMYLLKQLDCLEKMVCSFCKEISS